VVGGPVLELEGPPRPTRDAPREQEVVVLTLPPRLELRVGGGDVVLLAVGGAPPALARLVSPALVPGPIPRGRRCGLRRTRLDN
jgi:hypothetical protein